MFSNDQNKDLSAPLAKSNVATRTQSGKSLSYLESWFVISEANRIFGFDGWARETVEIRCVTEREREIGQQKAPGWGVSYICRVRVTVFAADTIVIREGCGAGHGIDRDLGQAHESAIKEAESDAAKRALMTFGNQFGLALYDKTQEGVVDDTRTYQQAPRSAIGAASPIQAATTQRAEPTPASGAPKVSPETWVAEQLTTIRKADWPALKAWEAKTAGAMTKLRATNPDLHRDVLDNFNARLQACQTV